MYVAFVSSKVSGPDLYFNKAFSSDVVIGIKCFYMWFVVPSMAFWRHELAQIFEAYNRISSLDMTVCPSIDRSMYIFVLITFVTLQLDLKKDAFVKLTISQFSFSSCIFLAVNALPNIYKTRSI